MTKVEYSDLYKFLVSLGLALVVTSVLLPWLFLRESFGMLTTQQTLTELPPTSREVLEQRREWVELLVNWWWLISLVLFVVGMILIIFGFFWWRKIQHFTDRYTMANTIRAEAELGNLTESEKREQLTSDVEFDKPEFSNPDTPQRVIDEEVVRRMSIEKQVSDKVAACFGSTYSVLFNKRIGDTGYDVVLQHRFGGDDVVVEIKTYESMAGRREVVPTLLKAILSAQRYTEQTSRIARSVVLFVIGDNFGSLPITIQEVSEADLNRKGSPKIHAIFCTLDRFMSTPCDTMREDFVSGEGLTRVW